MRRLIKQQKRAPTPPPRPQMSCFFLHVRQKRKSHHEPNDVTTANTNTPLTAVVYYAECDTGYSHTSPPTPARKHTPNIICSVRKELMKKTRWISSDKFTSKLNGRLSVHMASVHVALSPGDRAQWQCYFNRVDRR